MTRLLVSSIQRFCLHDGPGIRTTVFLQGCGLRCWWCHNPDAMPLDSDAAVEWEIAPLLQQVTRDARFWRSSGGGLTLSGGEPLLQADGASKLLAAVGRLGHHRCIETAGYAPLAAVQHLAPHVDLWLWDLKHPDEARFRDGTGGRADLPIANLRWLLTETPANVRVRVPVIAGFNDDDVSAADLASVLQDLPRAVEVEPLPGHDLCRSASPPERSAKVAPERFAAVAKRLREAVE